MQGSQSNCVTAQVHLGHRGARLKLHRRYAALFRRTQTPSAGCGACGRRFTPHRRKQNIIRRLEQTLDARILQMLALVGGAPGGGGTCRQPALVPVAENVVHPDGTAAGPEGGLGEGLHAAGEAEHATENAALFRPEIVVANCAPDALVFNLQGKEYIYNIEYNINIYTCLRRATVLIKGVTKRCRLSLLANRALVYESQCGGMILP